jgi:hypothetical protein
MLEFDPRIRKTCQWFQQRNCETVVVNHCPDFHNPTNNVISRVGKLDRCELYYVWRTMATYIQPAVMHGIKREDGSHFVPDIVYCHELEMVHLYLAQWTPQGAEKVARGATYQEVKLDYGKPPGPYLVYDQHEMETHRRMVGVEARWIEDRAWREKQCMPFVDQMLCVSEGIAKEMHTMYGTKDILLVPNSLPRVTHQLNRGTLYQLVKPNRPIVMFSGNLTPARRLPEIMSAVEMVGGKLVTIGRAVDAGTSVRPILKDLRERGATLIPFQMYPYCGTPPRMLDLIAGGQVGVDGTDTGIRSYELSLPNKLYEYSAASIPSVHSEHMEECSKVCKEYGIGSAYDNTAEGLAKEIQFWLDNPPAPEAFERFNEDHCYQNTCGKTIDEVIRRARERNNTTGGTTTGTETGASATTDCAGDVAGTCTTGSERSVERKQECIRQLRLCKCGGCDRSKSGSTCECRTGGVSDVIRNSRD